ncbi:MAG: hypothetical protein HQL74_11855 [Magnetococcales bacterium]|nr:hypothetical protein [Magnetococcales bacterium]
MANRADLLILAAAGVLAGTILSMGYFFIHVPMTNRTNELRQLVSIEENTVQGLAKTEAALKSSHIKKNQPRNTTNQLSAEFIASVSAILEKNAIVVNQTTPSSGGDRPALSLSFATDYASLVHFLAGLESIGVVMDRVNISAGRGDKGKKLLPVEMRFFEPSTLATVNDTETTQTREKLTAKLKVNPFEKERKSGTLTGSKPEQGDTDLTSKYRLTGIGQLANGDYVASINRKEYRVGDWLDDKAITKIQKDHVLLKTTSKTGDIEYRLGFRKQVTKTGPQKKIND